MVLHALTWRGYSSDWRSENGYQQQLLRRFTNVGVCCCPRALGCVVFGCSSAVIAC